MPGRPDTEADVLILKAAELIRAAAQQDTERSVELCGVADYLESIPFQDQLDPPDALKSGSNKNQSQPKKISARTTSRPFTVRLTR